MLKPTFDRQLNPTLIPNQMILHQDLHTCKLIVLIISCISYFFGNLNYYLSTKLSSGRHLCIFSTILDINTLLPQPLGPETMKG